MDPNPGQAPSKSFGVQATNSSQERHTSCTQEEDIATSGILVFFDCSARKWIFRSEPKRFENLRFLTEPTPKTDRDHGYPKLGTGSGMKPAWNAAHSTFHAAPVCACCGRKVPTQPILHVAWPSKKILPRPSPPIWPFSSVLWAPLQQGRKGHQKLRSQSTTDTLPSQKSE